MRRDAAKEDYLRTIGIRLLRIPNGLVLEDPEGFVGKVREQIRAVADGAEPS
jgi:very-short-patch-repair endonuclease